MSKRFELPHIGVFEFSAENEQEILKEYEKRGRIKIAKQADASDYFSALRPPEEGEARQPEFNQTQPIP